MVSTSSFILFHIPKYASPLFFKNKKIPMPKTIRHRDAQFKYVVPLCLKRQISHLFHSFFVIDVLNNTAPCYYQILWVHKKAKRGIHICFLKCISAFALSLHKKQILLFLFTASIKFSCIISYAKSRQNVHQPRIQLMFILSWMKDEQGFFLCPIVQWKSVNPDHAYSQLLQHELA